MAGSNRIYLSPPHLGSLELAYIQDAIDSNWIAPLGPHVDAFEKEVANYVNADHALALSSGTAALHLALIVVGVSAGDTVFCSDLTFVASANAILYQQALPVFIDCDETTWTLCPTSLKNAFNKAEQQGILPKAVVVTDLYGQSADYDAINKICRRYEVPVIADAAEALGAQYKGQKCGSIGQLNVLSFNGNKIITTSGGGMLLGNNADLIAQARKLSSQARDQALHYEHSTVGYNYRLSNILSALGRGQLEVLEDHVYACRKIFDEYAQNLSEIEGIQFMPEAEYGRANRWLTAFTIDRVVTGVSRNTIIAILDQENIEARPIWKPMHMQPLFKNSVFHPAARQSISEKLFENGICLPSGSNLSAQDQGKIINILLDKLR